MAFHSQRKTRVWRLTLLPAEASRRLQSFTEQYPSKNHSLIGVDFIYVHLPATAAWLCSYHVQPMITLAYISYIDYGPCANVHVASW